MPVPAVDCCNGIVAGVGKCYRQPLTGLGGCKGCSRKCVHIDGLLQCIAACEAVFSNECYQIGCVRTIEMWCRILNGIRAAVTEIPVPRNNRASLGCMGKIADKYGIAKTNMRSCETQSRQGIDLHRLNDFIMTAVGVPNGEHGVE
ncbi:hypothetical protein SDC9_116061 [bioreactor metagenome]|uniref:Uncharacterized protein n=1 Tax=bioreactor metagenome TaxID=1076179 RepID=A0A645BV97_9ZZZZ